jgi:hypothetical protein
VVARRQLLTAPSGSTETVVDSARMLQVHQANHPDDPWQGGCCRPAASHAYQDLCLHSSRARHCRLLLRRLLHFQRRGSPGAPPTPQPHIHLMPMPLCFRWRIFATFISFRQAVLKMTRVCASCRISPASSQQASFVIKACSVAFYRYFFCSCLHVRAKCPESSAAGMPSIRCCIIIIIIIIHACLRAQLALHPNTYYHLVLHHCTASPYMVQTELQRVVTQLQRVFGTAGQLASSCSLLWCLVTCAVTVKG